MPTPRPRSRKVWPPPEAYCPCCHAPGPHATTSQRRTEQVRECSGCGSTFAVGAVLAIEVDHRGEVRVVPLGGYSPRILRRNVPVSFS